MFNYQRVIILIRRQLRLAKQSLRGLSCRLGQFPDWLVQWQEGVFAEMGSISGLVLLGTSSPETMGFSKKYEGVLQDVLLNHFEPIQ
jgi:hypothetical protein